MDLGVSEYVVRIMVIKPEGRVDTFTSVNLRNQLETLLTEGVSKFVIDLSNVTFLDSAGMAVLVSVLKRARQAGGDVKLVWPKEEPAQRILRLTKFDRVFEMVDAVPEAVQDF